MATGTNDVNALTSYGVKNDPTNETPQTFSTKIVNKAGPHIHKTEYRSATEPVEKIALAELLVNHDNAQPESISEAQRNDFNLVKSGSKSRIERGRVASDISYGDIVKPSNWISRFRFAVILVCFLGLFLFSYRLQNYSNELRLAILSLEERISANNTPIPNELPTSKVLTEINEKYLILERKVSEIANMDMPVKIPATPPNGRIEKNNDVTYQSLEKRLATLEQQLSKQSGKHTSQVDPPVLVKKKTIKQETIKIDESLTKEPVIVRRGWVVNLLSFKTMRSAEKVRNQFSIKGIHTQPHPVNIKGNRWYRLRALGFPTRRKAIEFGDAAKSTLGLKSYWIAFE